MQNRLKAMAAAAIAAIAAIAAMLGALAGGAPPAQALATDEIPPLKLQGRVDRTMYEALLAYPGDTVIVNSGGGSIAWGISIAEYIARRGMTVRAEERCLSACFDYILLPAKRRQVAAGTLLGMHPGPLMLEEIALAQGRPVPERTVQFAAMHREALRISGIHGIGLHMRAAIRMDLSLLGNNGGCWFEGAPSEEGLISPDCFRYSTTYEAWYPSTAQLRAFGIEIEGPEIAFRTVGDVLASSGWGDRAAAFGECLFASQPAPVLVCPNGEISRAAGAPPGPRLPRRTVDSGPPQSESRDDLGPANKPRDSSGRIRNLAPKRG